MCWKRAREAGLLQDRRYHLKTYKNCFVGKDMVQWLRESAETRCDKLAVELMQLLQDNNVFHHVCDDHQFKNQYLFYRFCREDDTFPQHDDSDVFFKAVRLFESLEASPHSIKQLHIVDGRLYKESFTGMDLVGWIHTYNQSRGREEALAMCQKFIDHGFIGPAIGSSKRFRDNSSLFRFVFDFKRERRLTDLVLPTDYLKSSAQEEFEKESRARSGSGGSRMRRSFESAGISRQFRSFFQSEPESSSSVTSTSSSFNSGTSSDASVGLQRISADELDSPNCRLHKELIAVRSDSVGYGFVIRGSGPTYIQIVDPAGPAAAVGIRVGQYLCAVNGTPVAREGHQEVAKLILSGQNQVDLLIAYDTECSEV